MIGPDLDSWVKLALSGDEAALYGAARAAVLDTSDPYRIYEDLRSAYGLLNEQDLVDQADPLGNTLDRIWKEFGTQIDAERWRRADPDKPIADGAATPKRGPDLGPNLSR